MIFKTDTIKTEEIDSINKKIEELMSLWEELQLEVESIII